MLQSFGPTGTAGWPIRVVYLDSPERPFCVSHRRSQPHEILLRVQGGIHLRKNGMVNLRCLSLACVVQIVTTGKLGL
jgi:hypothetical protein